MIYVFSCCKEGCSLPARLCEACQRCFQESPCGKCCANASACAQDLFNRPLGGFVFMAFWIAALELGLCMYSAATWDENLKDCEFRDPHGKQVGLFNWLMVQAGFAALNVLFAPYMQIQLWRRLNEEARVPDDSDADVPGGVNPATGEIAATKHDIREAFKDVFLYDCGVLLYFLALVGSFLWSRVGYTWINAEPTTCNPDPGLPNYAALVGMFFPVFVVLYGCAWYCTMSWMDEGTTLIIRHGVAVAATAAAAAGRPVPGFTQLPQEPHKPPTRLQAAASLMQGRGGGSLHSGRRSAAGGQKYSAVPTNNQEDGPRIASSPPSKVKAFAKLLACLGLDLMGNASYFLPAAGEVTDVVFAPASAVMLKMMFNANLTAICGLAEEIGPYTDIIPTATIAWFLEYCLPDSRITRCMGIQSEWAMVGHQPKVGTGGL